MPVQASTATAVNPPITLAVTRATRREPWPLDSGMRCRLGASVGESRRACAGLVMTNANYSRDGRLPLSWRTRPGTSEAGSTRSGCLTGRCQRGVVIGFGGDLGDQLGVRDVALRADDDDCPAQQAGHGTVGDGDAVVLTEAVAECRRRRDVL